MAYVHGFVGAVPAANKVAYRKHPADAVSLFRAFGVTRMVEAWGDNVPDGKVTDVEGAVKATSDETIVFSWTEWPSKAVYDQARQKVFADPHMHSANTPNNAPRWVHGGFAAILDA